MDSDKDGNIAVRELRQALLCDEHLKRALCKLVGPLSITQNMLNEILSVADKNEDGLLQPQELQALLLREASRLSTEMALIEHPNSQQLSHHVTKVEHVKEARDWAVQRLTSAHQRSDDGTPHATPMRSPSQGSGLDSVISDSDILGRIVREAPTLVEEPEEPQISLEELVARELKEQSEFLTEITHRRDHGRQQLDAARKIERKHQETMRYLGARHRQLLKKIAEKKIFLPPLCPCGVACLEPHADQCANNCVFYKNHHAYEQALATLLASYDV